MYIAVVLMIAAHAVQSGTASGMGAAAGAEALQQILARRTAATAQGARLTYRVIDGALAKKIDTYCPMLWSDTEEVLLIEYGNKTFLMRTGFGDIGRSCKVN